MAKHILLISYDDRLLIARSLMLEQSGYAVGSALGYKEAIAKCKDGGSYDLLILGHSIPMGDKRDLIGAFRAYSTAPILSMWAHDEEIAGRVDYLAFSDGPEKLLKNVESILARRVELAISSQHSARQPRTTEDSKDHEGKSAKPQRSLRGPLCP